MSFREMKEQRVRETGWDAGGKAWINAMFLENRAALHCFLVNRLHRSQDAEDVVQEVYLRLCRLDGNTVIRNERAFLFTMAANLAVDHMRRTAVRGGHPLGNRKLLEIASPNPSPESLVCSREWMEAFRRAIDDMPPKQRRVFIMHKIENLAYRDVANSLGISVKMVEKHMSKALAYCRQRLSGLLDRGIA